VIDVDTIHEHMVKTIVRLISIIWLLFLYSWGRIDNFLYIVVINVVV
jgi:hypothetical protein